MSYCTGKNIEKSRDKAMKMLVIEKRPVEIIANHFGVHRSTIWRWRQKWLIQNNHKSLTNDGRSNREPSKAFRWCDVKRDIPSFSATPK